MNERIELQNVIINEDQIYITNSHTIFFNESFCEKVDVKQLIKNYNKLVKNAREKGIKVSQKYGTKKLLQENIETYEIAYNQYTELYNRLRQGVQEKVNTGIYVGYCDDTVLKGLFNLRNQIISMFYRSEVLSQMNECNSIILNHFRSINRSMNTIEQIYL